MYNYQLVIPKVFLFAKVMQVAGVYDYEDNNGLQQALARNSWRVKAKRLLESIQKPTMQQIEHHMKEVCVGLLIGFLGFCLK